MTTQELTPKEKQELQEKEQTRPGRAFVPDVDIREDENALWLWADMPGVTQEQVEVELHDNVLRLEGRVSLQEYEGLKPVYTEYNVGNYLRRFTLTNGEHFDRDHPSPFGRDLLRRYAIDDAIAVHFQLPSFEAWQATQERG